MFGPWAFWLPQGSADEEDSKGDGQQFPITDKYTQLIGQETEPILHGSLWHVQNSLVLVWCWPAVSVRDHSGQVNRIPKTDELNTRFADAHCPAHAFDGDFFDAACEPIVFNFAVVVVVARVDHGDLACVEFVDYVLRDERGENVLVLVAS